MPRNRPHPLTLLFWAKRFSIERGMQWLKDHGWIFQECEKPEDVDKETTLAILDAARMPMMAGESFRKNK